MGFALIPRRNPPPAIARSLPRLPGFEAMASLLDRVAGTAGVGLAYGEPITMNGRTVIPVGAVGYGFGAGFGGGRGPKRRQQGGGGGGGGSVNVQPVALIEITSKGVRVRPVLDWTRLIVALLAVGMPLIMRMQRRGRRPWRERMEARRARLTLGQPTPTVGGG